MTAAAPNRVYAALGLLAALLLAFGLALFVGWGELADAQLERDSRQAELDILQRRTVIKQADAEERLLADPFVEGATGALAANALQQRIAGLVEEIGGKLSSIAVEPASDEAEARGRVVVQASADMDTAALQQMLFRLETGAPFLFVQQLTVQRVSDEASAADRPQSLHVDMRIAGYQRPGSSS